MKHINTYKIFESEQSKPKFKIGDRLVAMDSNPDFITPSDDNMVVNGDAIWMDYDNHPKGGYWSYPIEGKANPCPEDFLTPYVKGQKYYREELPCHVYYKQRKKK